MTTVAMDSYHLTAPEWYVLQHGPSADARWVFKLTVLQLLTQKHFSRIGTGGATALIPGSRFDESLPPTMGLLREVYLTLPRTSVPGANQGAVTVVALMEALSQRYLGLQGFVRSVIMPVLVGHGFYQQHTSRLLFLFTRRQHRLTPKGESIKFEFERRLMDGQREFRGWVAKQPERAIQFLQSIGTAALLMRPIYPDIYRLTAEPPELPVPSTSNSTSINEELAPLREWATVLTDDYNELDECMTIPASVRRPSTDKSE